MKKNKILWLGLLLCLTALLLLAVGCESQNGSSDTEAETDGGPVDYTVKLTDYNGEVLDAAFLIEVFKGESSVGMKKLSADGTAVFSLERGDYTFVPKASSGEYHYNKDDCTFSADKHTAEVKLYSKHSGKMTVYPPGDGEHFAYEAALIGEGATYVEIDRPEMSYYLFTPKRGGIYRIGVIGDGNIDIGCYGGSNVVLDHKTHPVENNAFEIEVLDSSIGSGVGGTLSLVIGISSDEAKNAVIFVERIADPTPILPWTVIEPQEIRDDFVSSDHLNHKLVDISVTDPDVKVVRGNDGYYHYGDAAGPIVYIRISSASKYLGSFTEICEAANLCRFFYDEAGELVRKEGYNKLVDEYAKVCDGNGVVPLTEELANMVKNSGEHLGWWYFNGEGTNIFSYDKDGVATGVTAENIVLENAWLFACCYTEEFVRGSEDSAIKLTPSDTRTYRAIIPDGGALYFTSDSASELIVMGAAGLTVKYNGTEYIANEAGVLKISVEKGAGFSICGEANTELEFTFKLNVEE